MISMVLDEISKLNKTAAGIWVADTKHDISFPEDGNISRKNVEGQSFWYFHRNQCLLALLSRFAPAGPLLDIGGGNGTVSLALHQAGIPSILLEPEMAGACEGLKNGLPTVICSTFDDAGFSDESVHAAGAFDVMEHIEEDSEFLLKVNRALAPKGRFYLTVPVFPFLWSDADDHAHHCRRYIYEDLSLKLMAAGFNILYMSYFFSLLVGPIFLLRALPYKFGIRRPNPQWRHGHHKSKESPFASLFLASIKWEIARIKMNKQIPLGTSCIIAVEKI